MKKLVITILNSKAVVADKCHVAESFFDRLKGLIGRKSLEPGEAMLFLRCNSIHMWMMAFPIDVVFINSTPDKQYEVVSIREHLCAWKLFPVSNFKASHVLELEAGLSKKVGIKVGEILCLN